MTIFGEWKGYRQRVMPVDASEIQVLECRRAFYAGAMAFLSLTSGIMSDSDEITEADEKAIERIQRELVEFGQQGGLST